MRVNKMIAMIMAVVVAGSSVILPPATAKASEAQASVSAKERGLIAKFTFDNETDGFASNGYVAKKFGAGISNSTDAVKGNSMMLDGTSYLQVKNTDGKSPLDGLEELTISYYSKPSNRESQIYWGWTVYAAPDEETQETLYEHYIGVRDLTKGIVVERFHNNGKRPTTSGGVEEGDKIDWKYIKAI